MSQFNSKSPVLAGILGVCVGDALGLPVQFCSRNELTHKLVTEMFGYGTYNQPPGTWSDDSSLTLCIADALCKVKPIQSKRVLTTIGDHFCRWYGEGYWTPYGRAFDIGGTTKWAISRLLSGVSPQESGISNEGSNGNGSLMRTLPLAFCYPLLSFLELLKLTHQVSAITHAHPRSQMACGIYISIVIQLLGGASPKEAYDQGIEAIKALKIYDKPPFKDQLNHYQRVMDGNIEQIPRDEISGSGYVVHSLEASLWCLLNSDSYSDAVLKAVNLGDDTDTTAAITGGLAGVYYGVESIPEHWLAQIPKLDEIMDLGKKLEAVIQ